MSRYIDADEFWNNRPENLDAKISEYNRGWCNYEKEIRKTLEDTPTADVVEVVRCKDCKHYISDGGKYPYCEIISNKEEGEYYCPFDDHYCSNGERRTHER